MRSHYPFEFEREMGCTVAELAAWLPEACGRPIEYRDQGADIRLDAGWVSIDWQALVPRRIARIELPRTRVRFAARGVDAAAWNAFMRRFDLQTLRGGG